MLKSTIATSFLAVAILVCRTDRQPTNNQHLVSKEDAAHWDWLLGEIALATSIKPDMSRAELLKVFEVEGGLQRIPPERYVLRNCPYIKVNVKFRLPGPRPLARVPLDSELKIESTSEPYVGYAIAD